MLVIIDRITNFVEFVPCQEDDYTAKVILCCLAVGVPG